MLSDQILIFKDISHRVSIVELTIAMNQNVDDLFEEPLADYGSEREFFNGIMVTNFVIEVRRINKNLRWIRRVERLRARNCIACKVRFWSTGFHDKVCKKLMKLGH